MMRYTNAILSLLFAATMTTSSTGLAQGANPVVATVAGVPISEAVVQRRMLQLVHKISFHGGVTQEMYKKLRAQAIDQLINEALLYAEARRLKLIPSKAEVKRARDQVIAKAGGPKRFAAKLRRARQTWAQHWLQLERRMAVRALARRVLATQAAISEANVKAHYNKNPERFVRPPEVRVQQMHFAVRPTDPPQAWAAAEKRAQAAVKRLQSGEAFDKVAAAADRSPATLTGARSKKVHETSMGWMHKGRLVPELEQIAFSLKVGQFSRPIKVLSGYAVIRVEAHRPAKPLTYEEAAPQLRKKLREARIKTLRGELLARLRREHPIQRR